MSDWNSDGGSSELTLAQVGTGLQEAVARGGEHGRDRDEEAELGRALPFDAEADGAHDRGARAADARDHRQALDKADAERSLPTHRLAARRRQIGRASCRERVCQYV